MISNRGWSKVFIAGGTLFLIGITLLWNIIPVFDSAAAQFLSAGAKLDFWPEQPRILRPIPHIAGWTDLSGHRRCPGDMG